MSDSNPTGEDRLLTASVCLLVVIGLVVVYDASFPKSGFGQFLRQSVWVGVGMLAYLVGRHLSPALLYKLAPALAIAALGAMVAVLTPLGVERGGAARWLKLGQIGSFEVVLQPAEFGKVALIVWLSRLLCHPNRVGTCEPARRRSRLWLAVLSVLVAAGLVVEVQNDLGTALIFVGIGIGMLFVAGMPFRRVVALVAVLIIVTGFYIYRAEYRLLRMMSFRQPFAYIDTYGYQLAHSLMGIGTGGLWGTGLGLGRAKEFLPAADTDFVFTTVAEETGVIGSSIIIGLLALVALRMFHVAYKAQAMFLLLLASGVGMLVGLQSLLNLYVVTGAVPTTGVPLPFISYGGSSLVSLLFSAGLVQKASTCPMLERVQGAAHARVAGWRGNRRTPVSRSEYRRGVA
jgi:cell division protein FtsW (lipid II flippase)